MNNKIALVTAQIACKSQKAFRFLHAQAVSSIDEKQFMDRVNFANFSNNDNVRILNIIKFLLTNRKWTTTIRHIKSKNRWEREVGFRRDHREQQVVGLLYGFWFWMDFRGRPEMKRVGTAGNRTRYQSGAYVSTWESGRTSIWVVPR